MRGEQAIQLSKLPCRRKREGPKGTGNSFSSFAAGDLRSPLLKIEILKKPSLGCKMSFDLGLASQACT